MIVSFRNENRFLSNFWPCKVILDGVTYPSVENAYQAAKTLDPEIRKKFESCTAAQSKKMSRSLKVRDDWNEVKLSVMEGLLNQKFQNGTDLWEKLKSTTPEEIVEGNTWHDNFWGVCCCGKKETCKGGENHLGKLLMKIRS